MNYEIPYRTIDTKRIKINLGAFFGKRRTILILFFPFGMRKRKFFFVNG